MVEVNHDLMIETHEILIFGVEVDQQMVGNLTMLHKDDTIEEIYERIKAVGQFTLTY